MAYPLGPGVAVERIIGRKVSDKELGRLSGIPDCCIEFFETKYVPGMREPWNKIYFLSLSDFWDYVPCPACKESKRKSRLIRDKEIVETLKRILHKQ
jgi:hypothetical protein